MLCARCSLVLQRIGVLCVLVLGAGCADDSDKDAVAPATADLSQSASEGAASLVPVVVETLSAATWRGSIQAFGVIEALEEVHIAAELSGTVAAVHVNEGDRVEAGQLLLELDARKRALALQQVNQREQQTRSALREARQKLERRRNLAARETISQEILDNAQLAVDTAAAAHAQARAAAALARRELADTHIVSPSNGVIDVRAVEVGEPVQAGAPLITLQALDSLRVQTWVSEADIAYVSAGSDARIRAAGLQGQVFQARVEWVGVNADPATGNFPVKLVLTDPTHLLRPGMTARVVIDGVAVPGALMLPESALVDRDRRRVVFVVAETDQGLVARQREPVLAAGLTNRLMILDGLSVGDRIVVQGQSLLLDGTPLRIVEGN